MSAAIPTVRILVVEDSPEDFELLEHELRGAGLDCSLERVDTEAELDRALAEPGLDLVLSDFRLLGFDALTVLERVRELAPDVPVVVVTGSIDEETAVSCMRAGAADYVLKERLSRLAPRVEAVLEARRLRLEVRAGERRLFDSSNRFRELVEQIDDVIFETVLGGEIAYVSPAVETLAGYLPEEVVGRNLIEFVVDEDRDRMRAYMVEVQHHRGLQPSEFRVRMKSGETRWVRGSARPIERGGLLVGFRGALSDVTNLKLGEERLLRAQEQLLQAQKMEAIGRLAGGIAHDFNNVLGVILGNAEMLVGRLQDDDSMLCLREILDAARGAASVTRQLLVISRRQLLQSQVVDVGIELAGIERMLRRMLGEDVELVLELDRSAGSVLVDPTQLQQVLLNLAVNARDAMPRGGRLVISTRERALAADEARALEVEPGAYAEIAVADTGSGIAPAILDRVFEPFFTTKEPGKGTGLGLATVYGVVRQSGGAVELESQPGRGTTFRLLLPLCTAAPEEVPTAGAEPARAPAPGGRETILLVEDEPALRELLRRTLSKAGYRVLTAGDADHAEAAASGQAIDLLLTDLVLPGRDGRQLADALVAERPGLRVIFASGYAADVLGDLLRGSAQIDLLTKPFSGRELLERVRAALDRTR